MFATQLVRSNNVLSLQVDPAKTLVTRQWLFDNGFKINNYKTVKGITTFVIRSYTASGFAKLTAKYPVNAPAPVVIATPEPTPAVVIDSTHPDHPDFSDVADRLAEQQWMEQHPVEVPAYEIEEIENGARFTVQCATPAHAATLCNYLIHDIDISCMATPAGCVCFALNEDGEFPAIAREVVETYIARTRSN